MTVRDIVSAAFRRWYAVLIVFVLTACLAVSFSDVGGTFTTRTAVTFTLPAATTLMENNGSTDASVIAFAGAIASEINRGKPVATYSSASAPYYGAGVRDGVLVSLRNDGNQWMAIFPSATIEIQIVGRTRAGVAVKQQELLTEIAAAASARQSASVLSPADRITGTVEPTTRQIDEILPTRSAQIFAIAALALAGVILSAWLAVAVDRAAGRRSGSRRRWTGRRVPTTVGGLTA